MGNWMLAGFERLASTSLRRFAKYDSRSTDAIASLLRALTHSSARFESTSSSQAYGSEGTVCASARAAPDAHNPHPKGHAARALRLMSMVPPCFARIVQRAARAWP